jgi:hypothetical protein
MAWTLVDSFGSLDRCEPTGFPSSQSSSASQGDRLEDNMRTVTDCALMKPQGNNVPDRETAVKAEASDYAG